MSTNERGAHERVDIGRITHTLLQLQKVIGFLSFQLANSHLNGQEPGPVFQPWSQ